MDNLLVMKFGGTSVGSADRIKVACDLIAAEGARRPVVAGLLVWALVRGVWPAGRRPAGYFRRGQQIEFAPREA